MTLFEISATSFSPQRFWINTGSQRGAQCGHLTVDAGANLFSHSLDPKRTFISTIIGSQNDSPRGLDERIFGGGNHSFKADAHTARRLAQALGLMKSRLNFKSVSKRARWVLYPTLVLIMLNFFTFIVISVHLGGDALNGYVHAGKYCVCAHGGCTQVSPATWHYSYWHAMTAIGGILLSFAEVALFINTGDITIDWNAP